MLRSGSGIARSILLLSSVLCGCGKFETSPYSTDIEGLPSGLNAVNAGRLAAGEASDDDTITFLFVGDCQRFYEEQEAMVATANALPGLDFVIMAGDLTDFGLLQEYEWVLERMNELDVPWFSALGNHDVQANGEEIFLQLFGPTDFTVSYKGCHFIFLNTNGAEYGNNGQVPDLGWLQQRLDGAAGERSVVMSHVPPTNADFDPALVAPYAALLAERPGMLASMHAHVGSFLDAEIFGDGVRYITCNTLANPDMILVRIIGDDLSIQHVQR